MSPAYAGLTVRLFLAFLLLYLALTRGHFWTTDEIGVYQQARSLWERGDLATAQVLNTVQGRGGKFYAPYAVGQSFLSLPLYGMGKAVRTLFERRGWKNGIAMLAGEEIAWNPSVRWGGEVEIFFVNLFNAFTVAALAAVFFAFSLRLGASPPWALAATLLLGLTSHIAGFSTGYFQHAAESLFLLWTFYFLFCDATRPAAKTRWLAGAAAAAMILVRLQTGVALPALSLYLLYRVWMRAPGQTAREKVWPAIVECSAFAMPVAAAILFSAEINFLKFGRFDLAGSGLRLYANEGNFGTPFLAGLYGMLFSAGSSIFAFTPVLAAAPAWFPEFAQRFRAETACIFGCAAGYVLLYYGNIGHGQWCFGPRYLVALVPLLMLPLARWLPTLRVGGRVAVAALALCGVLVEVLHVAVNVSAVHYAEGYENYVPKFSYLFIPQASPIAAHWRALLAWDGRVDFWLVNIARHFGVGQCMWIALIFLWLLAFTVWRLAPWYRLAIMAHEKGVPPGFRSGSMDLLAVVAAAWLAVSAVAAFWH